VSRADLWSSGRHDATLPAHDQMTVTSVTNCLRIGAAAFDCSHHTTIKIRSEFRNVGDAACAMSHTSGRPAHSGWLQGVVLLAAATDADRRSGPACYKLSTAGSYAAHSEILRTEKGMRKGTDSAQRDKPLDESRGEVPSHYNARANLHEF